MGVGDIHEKREGLVAPRGPGTACDWFDSGVKSLVSMLLTNAVYICNVYNMWQYVINKGRFFYQTRFGVRLDPNGTTPRLFQIGFQYILVNRAKMYRNLIWKSPGFFTVKIWPKLGPNYMAFLNEPTVTRDAKFSIQIGSYWPRLWQIVEFLRSVSVHFGSTSQNVLKLIFKSSRFVSFGANLTTFECQILHPSFPGT